MINVRLYLNKIKKFNGKFFSNNLSREIGAKRNKFGIPVIVLDLKTKKSYEYLSIAEAARSFNTHSKTIWRIVYNNKLYLNRYQIIENNGKGLGKWYYINSFFKYIKYIYNKVNIF